MSESFLPSNYVAPASGGFAKLEIGDNTFRIVTNPVLMWVAWENKVVTRTPYMLNGVVTTKPVVPTGDNNSVSFTWSLGVYNYKTKAVEVLDISQKGLQSAIEGYASQLAWGHPSKYDIIINKTGTGKETKYALRVNPPLPVSVEVSAAIADTPLDLNQLLVSGGNPFLNAGGSPASTQAAPAQKVVTPENYVTGDEIPQGFVLNPEGQLVKSGLPF